MQGFSPAPMARINVAASGIFIFNPEAIPLFEQARARAGRRRLLDWLFSRPRRLLILDEVVGSDMLPNAHYHRVQDVLIGQIRGSVNRAEDFDSEFYPLHNRLRNRWVRIASMMLQGTSLPPVELAQVGDVYFVVDGHHRISVAKMLKYERLDAIITAVYDAIR